MTASGEVANFSYRIESKIRGMPHVHGVFWLRKDIIDKCKNGDEFINEEVEKMIDNWITCSLNTCDPELDALVSEVNIHRHTKSCQRGTSSCRFNFPRLPSKRTLIASPPSADLSEEEREHELKSSKDILEVVRDQLINVSDEQIDTDYGNDINKFLQELDITYTEYEKALMTSQRGKVVIMKRTLKEQHVNNYKKEWMLAWRGNLDLQFCYDAYAVVTYITDYLSNADAGITAAFKKALNETRGWNDFERLNYMKKVFFPHRQVSVAEAAYRLIPGINLKRSDVKTTFVSSGYPENRSCMYVKVNEDQEKDFDLENEDEDNTEDTDTLFSSNE